MKKQKIELFNDSFQTSLQSLIPDEGLNDYGKGYKKGIQDCFNLVKKTLLESQK